MLPKQPAATAIATAAASSSKTGRFKTIEVLYSIPFILFGMTLLLVTDFLVRRYFLVFLSTEEKKNKATAIAVYSETYKNTNERIPVHEHINSRNILFLWVAAKLRAISPIFFLFFCFCYCCCCARVHNISLFSLWPIENGKERNKSVGNCMSIYVYVWNCTVVTGLGTMPMWYVYCLQFIVICFNFVYPFYHLGESV